MRKMVGNGTKSAPLGKALATSCHRGAHHLESVLLDVLQRFPAEAREGRDERRSSIRRTSKAACRSGDSTGDPVTGAQKSARSSRASRLSHLSVVSLRRTKPSVAVREPSSSGASEQSSSCSAGPHAPALPPTPEASSVPVESWSMMTV